jgi:hypothetical protein
MGDDLDTGRLAMLDRRMQFFDGRLFQTEPRLSRPRCRQLTLPACCKCLGKSACNFGAKQEHTMFGQRLPLSPANFQIIELIEI